MKIKFFLLLEHISKEHPEKTPSFVVNWKLPTLPRRGESIHFDDNQFPPTISEEWRYEFWIVDDVFWRLDTVGIYLKPR